jgi:hypothetical protein
MPNEATAGVSPNNGRRYRQSPPSQPLSGGWLRLAPGDQNGPSGYLKQQVLGPQLIHSIQIHRQRAMSLWVGQDGSVSRRSQLKEYLF